MLFRLFFFTLLITTSCKTTKLYEQPSIQGTISGSPMTCHIKAKVLEFVKDEVIDTNGVCALHPCKAIVEIIDFGSCGASVTLNYKFGDKVSMQFAYTLDDTKNIFPKMKSHFPGLKVGDVFSAIVHQRLQMGADGIFVVYDYQREGH